MSLNVPNVSYSYAAGPIGCAEIGVLREIEANSSLKNIHDDYVAVFAQYEAMYGKLLGQMNKVLGLLGIPRSYSGELDLTDILDNNELINVLALQQGQCKEGAKAYKYYVSEVVSQLNALYAWNKRANEALAQLDTLSEDNEAEAHYLISQLEIADQHAQEVIKAFTQYAVVKKLNIGKLICYNNGIEDTYEESHESYTTHEFEYDGILTPNDYTSRLGNFADIDTLDKLRNIQTTKYEINRGIVVTYLKEDGTWADKYDGLARRVMKVADDPDTQVATLQNIALFDELPLLDKLAYIILYYKRSGDRYVYPQDAATGFPCVLPATKLSPTEDTAELGQLEMFYIGYLIDRDGPVNALASFMEVKSAAIQAQIVLMSYRIKALQHYVKLLNKGLEELNKSQASGIWTGEESKEKPTPIPQSSYYILRYLGANTTRSLLYFKDANGNFLDENFKDPYLAIQYATGEGPTFDETTGKHTYHLTATDNYILLPATEEGINSFVNLCCPQSGDKSGLDDFFVKPPAGVVEINFNKYYENLSVEGHHKVGSNVDYEVTFFGGSIQKTFESEKCLFLHIYNEDRTETGNSITYLPKELDVPRSDVAKAIEPPTDCMNWDGSGNFTGEGLSQWKEAWQSYVGMWTSEYDTVIGNYQSQLEYTQKALNSLRKKINTFDTMSSSFRSKAYTIYNKIVNKIN